MGVVLSGDPPPCPFETWTTCALPRAELNAAVRPFGQHEARPPLVEHRDVIGAAAVRPTPLLSVPNFLTPLSLSTSRPPA